jgi:hypothetical protein
MKRCGASLHQDRGTPKSELYTCGWHVALTQTAVALIGDCLGRDTR